MRLLALPGGLDGTLVFNSNNPEIVTEEGITLSTLAAPTPSASPAFLDLAFAGRFSVFSHHIARDRRLGERLLHLGLLAHNPLDRPVTLRLLAGASFLSQPDAPFLPLGPVLPDPEGLVHAGPGDRAASVLLRGRSSLAPTTWLLPARSTRLLLDLPLPTEVEVPPPINGRTTMLRLEASGRVHLSEVAAFAPRDPSGAFVPLQQADFERVLARGRRAGPEEGAATAYDPRKPAPPGFRYGRVGGVTQGDAWRGDLSAAVAVLGAGERLGVPIASVFLNRLGTPAAQSAPVRVRYAGSAFEGHGNYGVAYTLDLTLHNPDRAPRAYALSLSHPLGATGVGPAARALYVAPPEPAVTFRGTVRVDDVPASLSVPRYTHLTLRRGQQGEPFEVLAVAGRETRAARISLIYPADATPPQLLVVERLPGTGR